MHDRRLRLEKEPARGEGGCESPGQSGLHSGSATWKTHALERVVSFSEPQLPHLETGVSRYTYLIGPLGGWNWPVQISAQKVLSADPAAGDHENIVFTRPVQGAARSQEGVKEEVSSPSATQAGCVECARSWWCDDWRRWGSGSGHPGCPRCLGISSHSDRVTPSGWL